MNFFKNLFDRYNNSKYLIITPPLLRTDTFYIAGPVVVGQLINAGYDAKNLDLNIKFFRKLLTKDYIEKTENLLKSQNKKYNVERINYLKENVESSIEIYRNQYQGANTQEEIKNAQEILEEILKFESEPYLNFCLNSVTHNFENAFGHLGGIYKYVKEITFDKNQNIFIDVFEETINQIKKEKIDFVGITIPFKGNLIPALTLARMVKEKTKAYVAIGGNFLSETNIKKHPEILDIYCDSVMTGPGEISIVQLAEAFKNPSKLNEVYGLIYKDKHKKICYNDKIEFTDMEKLAILSLEGIDLNEYLEKYPSLYMVLSKSCYWGKCLFCSTPKYKRYNIKSPQKVVAEIKEIQKKYYNNGFMFIQFQDDALPPAYLSKLADEILKENLNINYFAFGRMEKEFTRELLEKLYKSGLRIVFWGLESGCQNTLNAMNKGIDLKYVPDILKNAHEIGIENSLAIIVNYPKETLEDYNETINFINSVKPYITRVVPGQFIILHNSYIEKHPEEFGLIINRDSESEFEYEAAWHDTNITPSERQKRWDNFCKFIKGETISIDETKDI